VKQLHAQARALDREFGARLSPHARATLDEFLDQPATRLGRLHHALTCRVYRQRAIDGAVVRTLLLVSEQ
jgi:hypothetical protein